MADDARTAGRPWLAGLFTGIALSAIAWLVWIAATAAGAMRDTYREFIGPTPGATTLPLATRIALSPLFGWGVPLGFGVVVVGLALADRTHRRATAVALGAIAAILVLSVVFEQWAIELPIRQLAGAIRTE